MKLQAFNIENYRSIINSGWKNLAHDNITALIGQNESGKTSVLGALYSFYNGTITEDVLRSDLSLPIVSCSFDMEKNTLIDFIDSEKLHPELQEIIGNISSLILTRSWNSDRSNKIFVSNDEILNYFEKREVEKAAIEEKTQLEVDALLKTTEKLFRDMELTESLKNEAQIALKEIGKKHSAAKKKMKRARKPDEKILSEKECQVLEQEFKKAEKDFAEKVHNYEELKEKTQTLSGKVSVCKSCNESQNALSESEKLLNAQIKLQKELEHQHEISTTEKDQKLAYSKLQVVKSEMEVLIKHHDDCIEEDILQRMLASKVLSGVSYPEALTMVNSQLAAEKEMYTIFDIGSLMLKYIPVFEFFEDFSSLLPNKIELEDILNENSHAEGYKAARNFLEVAGLNAEFFREKNQRILKQKIENLNGEITINFQDYWSQNVGKDSKIRLNFELEHYDYTHPEKSGKPYIEFWIKDKHERLYPKQRSRGVRWFLSFYLELKATAKYSQGSRVMLIDEPGLSLHARAQEDVLKVFEDLKESMQLVYCTHSPHLIDTNRLYRILAVQRANEQDDTSQTLVLDSNGLYSASSDTLSPIYSLMGVKINNQDFIKAQNNILVEDTLTYYYLNTFCQLANVKIKPSFIPSTGLTNIPILANILLGWKVDFSILSFGEFRADTTIEELSKSFFFAREEEMNSKLIKVIEFEYPEDVFSTLDFKKFILQKREGITQKNSEYILEQGLSRTILASQFINFCETKNLTIKDFDDTTQDNINTLINKIIN